MGGGQEIRMSKIERASGDFDAGGAIALKRGVGDAGFRGAHCSIDDQTAPTDTGTGYDGKSDRCIGGAFSQQTSAISHNEINA